MNICEQCGRIHCVRLPDPRFCSTVCRVQHQQFMIDFGFKYDGTPTYIDYARTSADYLAEHRVTLTKRAIKILQDIEEEECNEDVVAFIAYIAQGNSTAEQVYMATHLPSQLAAIKQ